jgi:hypothetical protein
MSSDGQRAAPLRHADFLPHEGKLFRFEGWSGALRLASVNASTQPGWPPHLPLPFTLIFHGPAGSILPEGTYAAEADGARFTFHIMPIHTTEKGRQDYQAVFN